MNQVNIIGRLTRDPETRTTGTGKSVCSFSIAVDKRPKPVDGPTADFFMCTAWEKTADFVTNYLGKGRLVAVTGRLSSRKYTTSDGSNREVVEIVCSEVQGLDRPRDDADAAPKPQERPAGAIPKENEEYDPWSDQ